MRLGRAPFPVLLALFALIAGAASDAAAGVRAVDDVAARFEGRVAFAASVLEARSDALARLRTRLDVARAGRDRQRLRGEAADNAFRAADAEARARAIALGAARDRLAERRQTMARLETDLKALMAETVSFGRQEGADPRRAAQLRAYTRSLVSGLAEAEMAGSEAVDDEAAAEAALEGAQARLNDAQAERLANTRALEAADAAVADTAALALEAQRRRGGAAAWLTGLRDETRRFRQAAGLILTAPVPPAARLAASSLLRPLPPIDTPMAMVPVERPLLPVSLRRANRGVADAAPGVAGTFVLPVDGAIVERFGESGDKGRADRGIRIEAAADAPVRAPRTGRVAFAGPFRQFGLLLIIDHGNEYHSLLTGMSSLLVEKGDTVEAGQVVGRLREGSGLGSQLYLELRHRGSPINPLPWLASGQDKVRG
ncbi:MAG: peptidoglycan DD-metalloendopeptidase family protein [Geminicoccaceae bacterium]|nr:peptidoglycan DD-metalloendopeptidase family protein [Geminicoccaceae bacterium]